MSQPDVKLLITIQKRYYDIAMEIEALPETRVKLNYDGNPEDRIEVYDVFESFSVKVKDIYKKHKITTAKQRRAIQRARTIIQKGGVVE